MSPGNGWNRATLFSGTHRRRSTHDTEGPRRAEEEWLPPRADAAAGGAPSPAGRSASPATSSNRRGGRGSRCSKNNRRAGAVGMPAVRHVRGFGRHGWSWKPTAAPSPVLLLLGCWISGALPHWRRQSAAGPGADRRADQGKSVPVHDGLPLHPFPSRIDQGWAVGRPHFSFPISPRANTPHAAST